MYFYIIRQVKLNNFMNKYDKTVGEDLKKKLEKEELLMQEHQQKVKEKQRI